MKQTLFSTLFVLILSLPIIAQTTEKYDYHPPLKIPLVLASNFGELRPNHFHMGLDFKTNNKIGYRLYSIEEGYVSRIKVSPYGYGQVVYIDHPNGITSVYAHCSEFKGELDSLVKSTQKKEQNFVVEIFPGKGVLKVTKGQVIALSGNTGSSTAPHLHFELRDTKTEHALNPLKYGFELADSKAPVIRGIKLYGLTKDGYRHPNKAVRKSVVKGKTNYTISNNSITIPASYCSKSGGIGFAADVIDRLDGAPNKCGLYGSFLIVNGDTLFGQKIDRVPFESTRYVNSHKDYEDYQTLKKKLHKSFKTSQNDLPIYTEEGNGIIQAKPGDALKIEYVAYDASGNISKLLFTINISEGSINPNDNIQVGENWLDPNAPHLYESDETIIEFGMASVYEPCTLDHSMAESKVLNGSTPVNRKYKIKKKVGEYDGKSYLEFTISRGRKRTVHLELDRGWLVADCKYFGAYRVRRDTIAPSISPLNFGATTTRSALTWKVSDLHSGLADYDLFIDGEWYLLTYEYKGDTVTFNKPPNFKGKKALVLRAVDDCGNVKEWKRDVTFN